MKIFPQVARGRIWYNIKDMKLFRYTAVFEHENDDQDTYNVSFPSFPEICTFGNSKEEAIFMAKDALELTILSMSENGENLPKNKKSAKLSKNSFSEDLLVSVNYEVNSLPFDQNVKVAFA